MNVLSLFDGMSCGQIALERAGIHVDNYFASEIDKHAIKVTQSNYPDTIQLGDVRGVHAESLPKIDLLIGGSPCQGFSFAGKQLNFDDPRSALFFEYVRLLNECKPKYFLLENVRMKKEHQVVISSYLGVGPIEINSASVSAQNRKRLYWTNISGVIQPRDQKLVGTDYLGDALDTSRRLARSFILKEGGGDLDRVGYFGKNSTSQRVYGFDGKMPTLLVNNTGGNNPLWVSLDKTVVYRASISFCEWLQNVPANYTERAPMNQRYRMLGNGWTVDVIVHILNGIKNS